MGLVNTVDVQLESPTSPITSKGWLMPEESQDGQFVEMLRAFRRSGGLARKAELAQRLQATRSPLRHLGGCTGGVVCFDWDGQLWLPWFQFNHDDMSVRCGPAAVIAELAPVFDGWELARWFARPNLWIGNQRPIDLIDVCVESVLGAARADRFIAAG